MQEFFKDLVLPYLGVMDCLFDSSKDVNAS